MNIWIIQTGEISFNIKIVVQDLIKLFEKYTQNQGFRIG